MCSPYNLWRYAQDPLLSNTQVKKGLKKKQLTYSTTLKEEKEDTTRQPMPKAIKGIFLLMLKDMMPLELLKKLPPRREEDHKI